MKQILYSLALLCFISCEEPKNQQTFVELKDTLDTTLDSFKYRNEIYDTSVNEKVLNYTASNLSQSEIDEVIDLLHKSVDKSNLHIELSKYKLIFRPSYNKKKEKIVHIEGSCRDIPAGKVVVDGGKCYFWLKVNLTKHSFQDILINSEG